MEEGRTVCRLSPGARNTEVVPASVVDRVRLAREWTMASGSSLACADFAFETERFLEASQQPKRRREAPIVRPPG